MQVDPKKSREAHSQIGSPSPIAAASKLPHPDSLTSGCDLRGSHPVGGRSAPAGQTYPDLRPTRHIRIPAGWPKLNWSDVLFWCGMTALFFFGVGMLVGLGK